ncbi:discoidin domain-containing protein [Campylobacter coli]|uniref:discoidin domain-containing protein n=1 Tax=Campylobacter coli TaxID=195 RepID=UPI00073F440B|nr:discoidin domain-containing protein [Campylobacter coli]
MIWNEEDLIDIAKGRMAIQSSISRWSKQDDASRACDARLDITDHAFHTSYDLNPWWIVDLENVYSIEVIRVTNRVKFKERARTLQVCLSLDGRNWTYVDSLLYVWDDKLDILEININQFFKARYVKLFLNEKNYFHLKKVEVFIRKYPRCIISARNDGFGMRIEHLVIGLTLARKTGCKFYFVWPSILDMDYANIRQQNGVHMEEADKIFGENFLKKYFLESSKIPCVYQSKIVNIKNFNDILNSDSEKSWGWYSTQKLPSEFITDYSLEDCLSDIQESYKSITWSQRFQYLYHLVNKAINFLKEDFVALHLRGGELIYSDVKLMANIWAHSRHFPYEIAIDIILNELGKGKSVLIFGQDQASNRLLKEYFKNYIEYSKIKIVDDLIDEKLCNLERDFFELNLLARATSIISTPSSAFSRVASLIGGKIKFCSYMELYSKRELYEIIKKNINLLRLNKLQKAYSYYRLYSFGVDIGVSYYSLLVFIQKSVAMDPENHLWRIYTIDTLFMLNKIDKANLYIKESIESDYNSFFKALFLGRRYNWASGIYSKIDEKYYKYNNQGDWIMLVYCKILQYTKNKDAFYTFLNYFENKLDNEIVQKTFLEFEQLLGDEIVKKYFESLLPFQLGMAILENSRSLKTLVRIPLVLFRIVKRNRKEKKYNRKKLEIINDNIKMLHSREYKIGLELIKAHQSWYKGGYFRFFYFLIKNKI